MGKSAPEAPDYTAAAERQGEASRQVTEAQTWANRPEQVTPWGKTSWQRQDFYDPVTQQRINRWRETQTLNPELQQALNSQIDLIRDRSELASSMTGRLEREYGKPMNWGNLPEMGGRVNSHAMVRGQPMAEGYDIRGPELNPADRYREDAGNAIYQQWAERALPEQQRQMESARSRLYNMGLKEGDASFDNEMSRIGQQQGDALRQAQYQATIGSGAEAQRALQMDAATRAQLTGEQLGQAQFHNAAVNQDFQQRLVGSNQQFNEMMAASQYQNQRRQQAMAEQMTKRGFTLNEINALMSGQQVGMPSMPNFAPASGASPTNYLGAAQLTGQHGLDTYNAGQANMQGMMSGIGTIGGGIIGGIYGGPVGAAAGASAGGAAGNYLGGQMA